MSDADSKPELRITSDYASMVALGRRSGLETSALSHVIVAYGFFHEGTLVGCACLRKVAGEFTIECLAVDERWRGRGLGSALVRKIQEEAIANGAKKLWAVARQPFFFEKNGYRRKAEGEPDGPNTNDCAQCAQYLKDCSPAVMVKDI